jgi:hypothetical protein
MSKPGFRITRLESEDDETIELLISDPDRPDELEDLTAEETHDLFVEKVNELIDSGQAVDLDQPARDSASLVAELAGEVRGLRNARDTLFAEANNLRDQLTEARVENTNLKFKAAFPELAIDLEIENTTETRRAVELMAAAARGITLRVYGENPRGLTEEQKETEERTDHPFSKLINAKPAEEDNNG